MGVEWTPNFLRMTLNPHLFPSPNLVVGQLVSLSRNSRLRYHRGTRLVPLGSLFEDVLGLFWVEPGEEERLDG